MTPEETADQKFNAMLATFGRIVQTRKASDLSEPRGVDGCDFSTSFLCN